MYRKKNNNNRFKKEDNTFKSISTAYGYKGKPTGDNTPAIDLSVKALRNLPHSSYALKADPYDAALPTSEPYPILNKFNKVVGGSYGGEANIDGGNVQQYANSTTSNMLKLFDVMRLRTGINYRYIQCSPQEGDYPGKALIDEMRKAMAESVSILKATTFTQMAINDFAVETDLPMGSAEKETIVIKEATEDEPAVTMDVYKNTTDVLYAMSMYYQIFLQEGLSVMNWHNSFRMKQGVAIKNGWNREVAALNGLFGLFNKKAFINLLESINLSFEGEYIDKEFMTQLNTLTLIPSRRSDSMTDPVLELQCHFNHPSVFKVHLLDTDGNYVATLFDDTNMSFKIPVGATNKNVSYWDACKEIKNYLSLEATQLWARSSFNSNLDSTTENARYNQVKAYFDVITASFTKFKPLWSDYREALDVMARTGTIKWTKGFRPGIIKDTDVQLFWNVMVDHIYQMIFSGADKVHYDDATKRWRTYSLWNMYSGTPEYDKMSGGAFLTLSFKAFSADNDEQLEYLPILFNAIEFGGQVTCVACSRDGHEAAIVQHSSNIQENIVLNRLAPLVSQSKETIRIPTIAYTNNKDLTVGHFSNLYKMLCQTFGLCRVQSTTGGQFDTALDPDVLAIYQIEINDLTNMAIAYARANAPFRGTTSDQGKLGFATILG